MQAIKKSIKSTNDWGPALSENRLGTVYDIKDRKLKQELSVYSLPGSTGIPMTEIDGSSNSSGYGSLNGTKGESNNGIKSVKDYKRTLDTVDENEAQTKF